MVASALPVSLRLVKKPASTIRPFGAKLQIAIHLDPQWGKDLEKLVDWKLAQLGVKKAS